MSITIFNLRHKVIHRILKLYFCIAYVAVWSWPLDMSCRCGSIPMVWVRIPKRENNSVQYEDECYVDMTVVWLTCTIWRWMLCWYVCCMAYMYNMKMNVIMLICLLCILWGSIFVTFHHLSIPFKITITILNFF
jgi:hypothetical protein